jgi:4-hydroxy-3-methylbut-2-enyl diphosphate reductase
MISLGSIVHNPQVVERLRERGVDVARSIDDLEYDGRTVAITAHGVGPQVYQELTAQGADVFDTTCPIVTRAQQWARKLAEEGYGIIIFGDPDHKEVRGTVGWANGPCVVIPAVDQIATMLPATFPHRVAVLAQTTHTEHHFAAFVHRLFEEHMDRIHELRVINTLCNATTGQQAAAIELARQVDMMLVVGGRESSNTRHLAEVCMEEGVETHHIERPDEIDPRWLPGKQVVGVTAGASTPDFVIDAVVQVLEGLAPA